MSGNHEIQRAIFHCFKKQGVPGNLVKVYYDKYSEEYLIRKYWYMIYKIELGQVKTPVGWLRNNIENEFSENDGFWEWWKGKRDRILDDPASDENLKAMVI